MNDRFQSPRYPKKTLAAAVLVFFFLLFLNLFFQFKIQRLFRTVSERTKELDLLRQEMKQHQQVMELSVRMGAYSGYVSWESAHFRSKKYFHERLERIRVLLPNFPYTSDNENEIALRALDEKVFAAVRNGRMAEAKRLVESMQREQFVSQQELLVEKGIEIISRSIEDQANAIQRRAALSDWLNGGLIFLLVVLTVSVAKIFNAWAKGMREANNGLDGLIQEKIKELDLERMKALESAKMASLGEMAGGIAHEINNPLATIQMRSEQLRELADEGSLDKEMLLETTMVIEKTTARIATIVRGLRAFARDGKNDTFQLFSVTAILEETLDLCRERLKNNNVSFEVVAPAASPLIECRPSQISQVILNLVSNAFDATQARDEKWIRVTVEDHTDYVEIGVIDSGKGIPREIQEKMMQPFFTTKEIGKGTGLGLSISRSIIQSHGGQLSVDNNYQNTRLMILLPKKQELLDAA